MDDNNLVGIITFDDISKIPEDQRDTQIQDIMTKKLITSPPEEEAVETLGKDQQYIVLGEYPWWKTANSWG